MRYLLPLLLLLVACSGGEEVADVGAGFPDATPAGDATVTADAGVEDAEPVDVGFEDAAAPDAEPVDAGPPAFGPVTVDIEAARPPDMLSAFNVLRWNQGRVEYNARVVPYELNVPLFSDFAFKDRALWIPEGTSITYRATGTLEFPVGSAIFKTFLFADDLRAPMDSIRPIETRVLIKDTDGWKAYPYLWNEDLSDAEYFVRGQVTALDFIDPFGNPRTTQYLVPQKNQCILCHEIKDDQGERYTTLIGPRARYMNRNNDYGDAAPANQLEFLASQGMLTGLPPIAQVPAAFDWDSTATTPTTSLDFASLERASRDYLDINCAHCHRPNATQGMTSRLWLNWDNDDEFHLGFCKEPGSAGPGAAGRQYDIVPGDAEASILVFRTETEQVGAMMPLLGRSLKDDIAIGVLRGWVDGLPPDDCSD